MLLITLIILLLAIPLHSKEIHVTMYIRMTGLILFICLSLGFNTFISQLGESISIYCGNYKMSLVSVSIEELIFLLAGIYCLSNLHIQENNWPQETPIILVFSLIGSILLISSQNLISLTISLELQSLAIYIFATITKNNIMENATYAGLMYFLLGALASCLIFLGCSLSYISTGCLDISQLWHFWSNNYIEASIGLWIIIIAILFKIAAAPLHNWSILVYDSLPISIVTWIAVLPKISLLGLLIILLQDMNEKTTVLMILAALLSIAIGSLLGLTQNRIKRLFAYSSIGHIGFLLLSIIAIRQDSDLGVFMLYLEQYSITTILLFLFLIGLNNNPNNEILKIGELRGLYDKNPLLCITLTIAFFSLAGLPFLIGFFAKMETLTLCLDHNFLLSVLIAIVFSVISAGYYLKIIQLSFQGNPNDNGIGLQHIQNNSSLAYIIAILTLSLLTYFINPWLWINLNHLIVLTCQ